MLDRHRCHSHGSGHFHAGLRSSNWRCLSGTISDFRLPGRKEHDCLPGAQRERASSRATTKQEVKEGWICCLEGLWDSCACALLGSLTLLYLQSLQDWHSWRACLDGQDLRLQNKTATASCPVSLQKVILWHVVHVATCYVDIGAWHRSSSCRYWGQIEEGQKSWEWGSGSWPAWLVEHGAWGRTFNRSSFPSGGEECHTCSSTMAKLQEEGLDLCQYLGETVRTQLLTHPTYTQRALPSSP